MKSFLSNLRAAFREFASPQVHELDEDEAQSAAEATAARTAWIATHKHPAECAGGCRCERR